MIKKALIGVILVLCGFGADAQKRTVITDIIKVYNEFWLGGRKVTAIETDSTFTVATHNKIPTVKAVKDYVAANGGGISALTGDVTATGPGSAVATIATASASVRGLISVADWNTFNAKIGGSGTVGYIPEFTGTSTLGNSNIFDSSGKIIVNGTSGDSILTISQPGNLGGGYYFPTMLTPTAATNAYYGIGWSPTGNGFNAVAGIAAARIGSTTGDLALFASSNRSTKMGASSIRMYLAGLTGHVGVGTTSPAYRLDVNGDINIASGQQYRANGIALWSASGTNIHTSTNTVVGTTVGDSLFTIYKPSLGNSFNLPMMVTGNSNTATAWQGIGWSPTGNGFNAVAGIVANRPTSTTGALGFATSGNRSVKMTASDIRMLIDATGNVGIGTLSPGERLHIVSSAGTNPKVKIGDADLINPFSSIEGVSTTVGVLETFNSAGGGMLHRGYSMNSTTPGIVILGLIGSNTPTGAATEFRAGKLSGTTIAAIGSSELAYAFRNNDGAQTYMNVLGSGNVGIGVSPSARLHVVGGGSTSSTWTAQFHNIFNNNSLVIRDDGALGFGTATLSDRFNFQFNQNAITVLRNSNTNSLSDAATAIVTGVAGQSFGMFAYPSTYTANASRTGRGIFDTDSGLSNGMLFSTSAGTIDFAPVSTTKARITTTGNLLLGTLTDIPSSILTLASSTQGFLPPRMTAVQASAITSPAQGLQVFVTNTNSTFTSIGWWGYNGTTWVRNFLSSNPILVGGNSEGANLVIGTNDNYDVQFETGGVEKMRIIHTSGNLAIGATSAAARIQVVSGGGTSASWTAQFHNNTTSSNTLMLRDDARVGVGTTTLPAIFNIAAGTASVASLNIPPGTATSSLTAGNIENNGTNLTYSDAFVRYDILKGFSGVSSALDFPNLSTGGYSVLTFADSRVKAGDRVLVANPNFNGGAMHFTGGCTVDGTIYIEAYYIGPSSLDMPSLNYTYSIIR